MSLIYVGDEEIRQIQPCVAYLTIAFSCLGILLTFVFSAFNIRNRNYRLIKMSSPNINNIINFNCFLVYLCPILNSVRGLIYTNNSLSDSMCQVNAWLLPLSSTAIYAAMLTKAWRIYRIFDTSPKMKKVVIKDLHLVVYIVCLVGIDAILVLFWQLFDTVHQKSRYTYEPNPYLAQVVVPSSYVSFYSANFPNRNLSRLNADDEGDDGEVFRSSQVEPGQPVIQNMSHGNRLRVVFECGSSLSEVWITLLTVYKIILFMYGIYLAWVIRNVNVPSMNDSKYLILSTFSVIVCGLGSMTLAQLLRDWPDVVQIFFALGVISSTSITQCLIFIPKIRLWYVRRNDDNFKISLSQVFLHHASSSYCFTDKPNNRNSSPQKSNAINLEEELCELLHENSQLKNFLKQKEGIIRLLQEKIRMTKATLFQVNEQECRELNVQEDVDKTMKDSATTPSSTLINHNPNPNQNQAGTGLNEAKSVSLFNVNHNLDQAFSNFNSRFATDSNTCGTTNTNLQGESRLEATRTNLSTCLNTSSLIKGANAEQLKSDLDEVEELTSRVRNSISIDLSNTRRYSPLLYEYYRKQLELAKSIQCTYNIQCNTLFDAMTLMRRCLKDYCQTVHNPEYLAIETINKNNSNQQSFNFKEFLAKNSPEHFSNFQDVNQQRSSPDLSNFSPDYLSKLNNRCLKKASILNTNRNKVLDNTSCTFLTNLSSPANSSLQSAELTQSSSSAVSSFASHNNFSNNQHNSEQQMNNTNLNSDNQVCKSAIFDHNQTYV